MANEKRLIDANNLKNEMLEENPYIHFGPFGYCACSPKTDGELVFKRDDVLLAIDSAPTVDAVEVVHGRWGTEKCNHKPHRIKNPEKWVIYKCSVCCYSNGRKQSNYCPNCGARMDGERREGE